MAVALPSRSAPLRDLVVRCQCLDGRAAGDRIINEHDEAGEQEELYLVLGGRAAFELDGERRDAPAGTFVFVEPGVKRTAFAEEAGTSIVALGGMPGRRTWRAASRSGRRSPPCTRRGTTPRRPIAAVRSRRGTPSTPRPSTTSPVARASRAARQTRSGTCGRPSSGPGTVRRRARMGEVRHRLRPDPRRSRVQGTRRRLGVRRFSSVARMGRVSFPNVGPEPIASIAASYSPVRPPRAIPVHWSWADRSSSRDEPGNEREQRHGREEPERERGEAGGNAQRRRGEDGRGERAGRGGLGGDPDDEPAGQPALDATRAARAFPPRPHTRRRAAPSLHRERCRRCRCRHAPTRRGRIPRAAPPPRGAAGRRRASGNTSAASATTAMNCSSSRIDPVARSGASTTAHGGNHRDRDQREAETKRMRRLNAVTSSMAPSSDRSGDHSTTGTPTRSYR